MIHTVNNKGDVDIDIHGELYGLMEEAAVIVARVATEVAKAAKKTVDKPVPSLTFMLIIMRGALDLLDELDPIPCPAADPGGSGCRGCTVSAPELKPVAMPQPVQRHRRRRHSGVRTAAQ